jgi:serine phosphatase RsbU (regulator of sigma subunit)/predicted ester cyclase
LIDRFRGAWTRRDAKSLATLYADNSVIESPAFGTIIGRVNVERSLQQWFSSFPDARLEFGDLPVVADNRIVETSWVSGTDTGGFLGQAPTGRPFRFFVVRLFDVADGKIAHERRVYDLNGLLIQLARGDDLVAEASWLYRAARATAVLDQEVKIAAEIQRALLPPPHQTRVGIEVATASVPCRAIGGDFLDCFDLPDGRFGFVLGDVAGKGPPAALLAARIQGMFAAYSTGICGTSDMVGRINGELARRSLDGRFATLFYGVLSADGRLTYCNAGHNTPLVVGESGVRRLETGGVPTGLFPDAVFSEDVVLLDPRDVVIVFSDGVVEALDRDGVEFGEDRLLSAVRSNQCTSAADLLNQIMSSVREFASGAEQVDDITALVVRLDAVSVTTLCVAAV